MVRNQKTRFRGLAYYNTFTGDGSTTAFDLANDVPDGGDNDVIVVVDNVRQEPGASKSYTLGNDGSETLEELPLMSHLWLQCRNICYQCK